MSEEIEKNIINKKEKFAKYKKDKPWDNENIDHWKVDVYF